MKINADFEAEGRKLLTRALQADLVVVGGGLAGTCCAISAAREGLKVILVQDRPVLGGNASSEVRLWILGATSHMGNNNRWARESGIVGEILIENMYRNPEGNALILDTILLEKVTKEPNVTLLLNTAAFEVIKSGPDKIEQVNAFCSQNSTRYELRAPYFCDASGDGIVAFQAGAAFRMGAESAEEFGEGFAPSEEYGELLGHSMYFYSKDAGGPVEFVAPEFALPEVANIAKYRSFDIHDHGCRLWWIEYGGRMDTVHQSEEIKWELWRVIYGVWNYIKNSGKFPEAANLTLEWVATIPGKRESRRFEGDYMLSQKDVVEQRNHADAVAYGGWALDLHPADGVFSERPSCNQWHSKGIYQIPLRCLYSRNISNLWFAGRIISASHVAFGSSRVMATAAYAAQVLGPAVSFCLTHDVSPRQLAQSPLLEKYQLRLMENGQYIPGFTYHNPLDIARQAKISASSQFVLQAMPPDGPWLPLDQAAAQMIPVRPGDRLQVSVPVSASSATNLRVELRMSSKPENYTPDVVLERHTIAVQSGESDLEIAFSTEADQARYLFICLMRNEQVSVRTSKMRVTGLLSVLNKFNKAVATSNTQSPPDDIGIESFEFWCPQRRPQGHNLAIELRPGLDVFEASNIVNGTHRPTLNPNAWVAAPEDPAPALRLEWEETRKLKKIVLSFDTDYDHPMESTLLGHPERVMPFCVRNYRVKDLTGRLLYRRNGNYQSVNTILFPEVIETRGILIEVEHPSESIPAAIFSVECYQE